MKRKLICVALGALGLAVAGSSFAQSKYSGDVVKIGVLTDLSGVYSDLAGQGSVTMAQMAIDEFKAKHKPKFKIELVSADHQNKPDVGSSKAREWYDTDNVDMITDLTNSGVGLAVAKLTTEKNRISMNTGAASTRLTNEDCSPNSIHYAYDTYALANIAGKAVVKQGGDSWYFLAADYAFGASLQKDATDAIVAAGGKVVGGVKHPLGASDFSSFLLQAQASKAKIIGLANAGGDAINSIKAAVEFGITPNQRLVSLLTFVTDINALGLQTTQGMMFVDGYYWNLNDDTRALGRAYYAKMKKMPTMVQAGVYSSVMSYLKAVEAAGTDDTAAVLKQLHTLKINDGFAKNAYIRADGRMIHDMYLVEVKKPSESKEPWDFYNVKATVPGDEAFQPLSLSRCPLVKK